MGHRSGEACSQALRKQTLKFKHTSYIQLIRWLDRWCTSTWLAMWTMRKMSAHIIILIQLRDLLFYTIKSQLSKLQLFPKSFQCWYAELYFVSLLFLFPSIKNKLFGQTGYYTTVVIRSVHILCEFSSNILMTRKVEL